MQPQLTREDFHEERDIRITFVLTGEEALEFKRWQRKQNIRPGLAGRILLIEGMKSRGILPKWWRVVRKNGGMS